MQPMVIGLIQSTEIPGILITIGDGLLFTMVIGYLTTITVGPGFRDMNGDQHGYLGAREADNMDGLLSVPELALV